MAVGPIREATQPLSVITTNRNLINNLKEHLEKTNKSLIKLFLDSFINEIHNDKRSPESILSLQKTLIKIVSTQIRLDPDTNENSGFKQEMRSLMNTINLVVYRELTFEVQQV